MSQTTSEDRHAVTTGIVAALDAVPGLRPAVPVSSERMSRWGWDPRDLAVTLTGDAVEVRVVAAELPLRPILDTAASALRPALGGTPWAEAELRLVVTALDPAALSTPVP
jgi:hypothetical protein